MRINQNVAIISEGISLVPYCSHHVPMYHDWMQDPELQEATASEPLSLEQEYAMQRSWRQDHDKLTFIICMPRSDPLSSTVGEVSHEEREGQMVGDINLFLSVEDLDENEPESSPQGLVGEIELMIARKTCRRQGYGRAALLTFLQYTHRHLSSVLAEYNEKIGEIAYSHLAYLRVKIGETNLASLRLFESFGFERVTEHANFFGELELRLSTTVWQDKKPRSYQEIEYMVHASN